MGRKENNMNSVNIIGRLVRDPDVKRTDDGKTICDLRLAIDDTYSKEDRADFINVTVFGSQGGVCERYLRKGFLAGVSGHIRTDVYTDSEGVKRYPIKLVAERVKILQWPERKAGMTEALPEVQYVPDVPDVPDVLADEPVEVSEEAVEAI